MNPYAPAPDPPTERRVIVLGSTGSIGRQTLEVISHLNALHARGEHPMRYRIVGLAAGSNTDLLHRQAAEFSVAAIALANGSSLSSSPSPSTRSSGTGVPPVSTASSSSSSSSSSSGRSLYQGPSAAEELVHAIPCDLVVAAIVGIAGLPATLAAVNLGRDIALANKETLVAAGELVIPAARRSGSRILPVDSEHSALWQCLHALHPSSAAAAVVPPCTCGEELARAIITASGGPFRTWTKDRIARATPDEALRHPTWSMGAKVTVDSASLMNKALEIIEAHWLFGLEPERLQAVVHPQSIVHAMIETRDGSLIAQLAAPDMRLPIQHALTFPHRAVGAAGRLDLRALAKLEFEPPDVDRFPALGLAYDAIRAGGTSGAILNAANEAAVRAFLASRDAATPMPFGLIPETVAEVLSSVAPTPVRTLEDVMNADRIAREESTRRLNHSCAARARSTVV